MPIWRSSVSNAHLSYHHHPHRYGRACSGCSCYSLYNHSGTIRSVRVCRVRGHAHVLHSAVYVCSPFIMFLVCERVCMLVERSHLDSIIDVWCLYTHNIYPNTRTERPRQSVRCWWCRGSFLVCSMCACKSAPMLGDLDGCDFFGDA